MPTVNALACSERVEFGAGAARSRACGRAAVTRGRTTQPRIERDSPTSRCIALAIGIDDGSYKQHVCRQSTPSLARNVTNSSRARHGHARARPSAAHARAPHRRASNADSNSMCVGDLAISIDAQPYHRDTCPWAKLQTAENVTNSSRARFGHARAAECHARASTSPPRIQHGPEHDVQR